MSTVKVHAFLAAFCHSAKLDADHAARFVRVWALWHLRRRSSQLVLCAIILSGTFHLLAIIGPPRMFIPLGANDDGECDAPYTCTDVLFTLPPMPEERSDFPLNPPPVLAENKVPSALPRDMFDDIHYDPPPSKLNGFADADEGGTGIPNVPIHSGGGGGSDTNAAELSGASAATMPPLRLSWK